MKDVDALILRERKRIVENVQNEYLAAARRQEFLGAALAEQKKEVDKVDQFLIEFNLLKREFDSNQTLYDGLLQRLKDATVTAGLRATNIHTIDEAPVPSYPVRPNKMRNIEFALAAGLALGIALAFTQEALDNSLKNAQEMEKLTGLPTLAIIPMGHSSLGHRSGLLPGTGTNGNGLVTYRRIVGSEETGSCHFRGISGASHLGSFVHRRAPTPGVAGDQCSTFRGKDFDFAEPGCGVGAERQSCFAGRC